jgi:hypothetical protein
MTALLAKATKLALAKHPVFFWNSKYNIYKILISAQDE